MKARRVMYGQWQSCAVRVAGGSKLGVPQREKSIFRAWPSKGAMRPNPSLERTSTGKPLGPRNGQYHHPLRGPSALPVASAQLKR
jgi:hypothetical protein